MFIVNAWIIMQPQQQHEQPHMSMSNASTIMMTVTMELIKSTAETLARGQEMVIHTILIAKIWWRLLFHFGPWNS